MKFEAKITRTIYSNNERSEQFLVTKCFFNFFLEVSHIICKDVANKKMLAPSWDLCDGGQNLPPLVEIGLRYLKTTVVAPVTPVVTSLIQIRTIGIQIEKTY